MAEVMWSYPGAISVTKRAQYIEGRFTALLHLLLHVELDLIERHMAWTFHHHLHIVLPGAAGEFTQGMQFSQLSSIRSIVLHPGRRESPKEKVQS